MQKQTILGLIETVKIKTPTKTYSLKAKIDTGARRSAIDVSVAEKIGYKSTWMEFEKQKPKIKITKKNFQEKRKLINQAYKKKLLQNIPGLVDIRVVPATNGFTLRPYVKLTYYLKGIKISSQASIVERRHMRYLMLVGVEDMKNFRIDPTKNIYKSV
ncbi:MAG: RimK/LysX family protein [Patescibacteria group bacterium]|nr:RimK/LysX family protein [Patescibacteria group bacterium]